MERFYRHCNYVNKHEQTVDRILPFVHHLLDLLLIATVLTVSVPILMDEFKVDFELLEYAENG